MSDLWTGHASYKMITKHCGLVDLLSEGNVMADRGFYVQDILSAARVTLNIPPTLPTSRSQFTLADVDKTRRIANVRIFVECAIGRIKGYHILDGTMPISLAPLVDHIVHVCGYLTNFLPVLVTD